MTPAAHAHVPARRVLLAAAITTIAAAIELLGSDVGGTLFLTADACHLLAHVGIFAVLLMPAGRWHGRGEDVATATVLLVVLVVAVAIGATSVRRLATPGPPPAPGFMLLALFGLAANLATAYLFVDPARTRWSFRAALAHELADGGFTVAGLLGALAVRVWAWTWVDPALSLAIAGWLGVWAVRLLGRRVRGGPAAWTVEAAR